MDTRKDTRSGPRLVSAAAGALATRRTSGTIRTCIPARSGQGGYREPADINDSDDTDDTDAHIVRGED